LWGKLRTHFPELKFRRQHPIAIYIADFYCHSKKIVIELDGSIHNLPEVKKNDEERQHYMESLGIRVLRFTNKEVSNNIEATLQRIEKIIK